MTTPERLRRRQIIEARALIALAIFTILLGVYFQRQDQAQRRDFAEQAQAQRDCLTRQVQELTASLTARGRLTQVDSDSTTRVILSVAKSETGEQVRAALDRFVKAQRSIDIQRRQHPVSPFPTGACD